MANNKFTANGQVLLDLTTDDLTSDTSKVANGLKYHGRDGVQYTGTHGDKTETTATESLNMASGDQVISAASGTTLSQVTVTKPATLLAENIKKDVVIGGVTGSFDAVNTRDANATSGDILLNKTGYVNNTKVTGTIPSKAAATITPTTTDQTIASGQYLSGTQTILGDANLLAENIKKDVVIFGITGSHEGGGSSADLDALLQETF